MSLKKYHPEQQDGEIYMGNADPASLARSSWKTSRLGERALDRDGNVINKLNGIYPWFILRREVENAIADPANERYVKHWQTLLDKNCIIADAIEYVAPVVETPTNS